MNADARIDSYLQALSRALAGLAEPDRRDIVAEIRAHLDHRAAEGRLDEALKSLGPAQQCARGFLDELKLQDAFTDAGPVKTFAALLALASRRATASVGLFVSGVFFLCAAGFAISAVAEVVSPDSVGLWVDPARDIFAFGVVDMDGGDAPKELLGRWMLPVAAGLALVMLLVGQWLGRFFIRLMMKNPTAAR